jgi:hypothetical protein
MVSWRIVIVAERNWQTMNSRLEKEDLLLYIKHTWTIM